MYQTFGEKGLFKDDKEYNGREDKSAFLANLLASVHDAIMAVDENLIVTYWNKQAEILTGWSELEVIKRSAYDLYQTLNIFTSMEEIVESLNADGCYVGELAFHKKDGSLVYGDVHIKRIFGQQEEYKGVVASFRDITKRKLQDEQLQFHANVLANVHDAIFAVNENYTITYWGGEAEKIMGWTAQEALGLPFFEIMKPEFLDTETTCDQEIAKMFKENKYNNQFICHSKDGVEIYISAHTSIIRDKNGDIKEIITSFRDITEQKKAETALREKEEQARALAEELKKADKNKNDFIGVLSHELRNPLATIVAALSLLEHSNNKEQREKAKETFNRQVEQLCKLVDDLLDLTRLTQNRIALKKEYINVNQIVMNAIEDMGPEYEKKGVQLEVKIHTKPIYMEADPVRIMQAIGNILYNALKFTHKDGMVWLTLQREKNEAVISIKDNGIGISAEVLSKLFKPFTQADNALGRRNNGLGLGLSIVKGIVDLHDGSVFAFSKGLGLGSEFTIHLPISSTTAIELSKPIEKRGSRSLQILLIEDNMDLANVLGSMLEMMGHKAVIAFNGMDGIYKAKAVIPDIIFCDIGMPEMDGYEVARNLRQDIRLKDIYMVALTGYADTRVKEYAKEAGFSKHLAKPINKTDLEYILAELI